MTEQPEEEQPELHPLYRPAVSNSVLTIHFVGNTAIISHLEFEGNPGVDPYQMLGAAEELKRKGFQMLQAAEVQEAKRREEERIPTASELPPSSFKRP